MNISIVMPWRDSGCPYRRRAYEFVTAYWRHHLPDAELVIDGGDGGDWNFAAALNGAVRRASHDVLFEVGPDGIVTPESVRDAAKDAAGSEGLVNCQTRNFHLNQRATNTLIASGVDAPLTANPDTDCEYSGNTSSDIACFSRTTWLEAGGFDERFGVWGGVDSAFFLACETLVAPGRRVPGTWVHLWHPRLPQSYPGHPGYTDQQMLLDEYGQAAADGREAMLALVDDRYA